MDQSHLRGIPLDVEHAFAEKRGAEGNAVKPADQPALVVDFDGMAVALLEKGAVELPYLLVDLGFLAICAAHRATGDDFFEVLIRAN